MSARINRAFGARRALNKLDWQTSADGRSWKRGRRPRIPPELKRGPFTLQEARDAGLSRHCLRGKTWQRLGFELYRWAGLRDDPWLTLSTWSRLLPPEMLFTGASGAWLHGLDLESTDPVEIVVSPSSGVRSRSGLLVHHSEIATCDVLMRRGLRTTALPLSLLYICLQWPELEALIALDMAVHLGLAKPDALVRYADLMAGKAGAARLRALAPLAAPAESPMETRLRWLLIRAGLPHPQVQVSLRDSSARFVGRADLYYPTSRLALEYDGGNHRERMVEDDRRQNALVNAGYRLLRFTAPDIHGRAEVVLAQVRAALGDASATRTLRSARVSRALEGAP